MCWRATTTPLPVACCRGMGLPTTEVKVVVTGAKAMTPEDGQHENRAKIPNLPARKVGEVAKRIDLEQNTLCSFHSQ